MTTIPTLSFSSVALAREEEEEEAFLFGIKNEGCLLANPLEEELEGVAAASLSLSDFKSKFWRLRSCFRALRDIGLGGANPLRAEEAEAAANPSSSSSSSSSSGRGEDTTPAPAALSLPLFPFAPGEFIDAFLLAIRRR